jgi:hypothetical protein
MMDKLLTRDQFRAATLARFNTRCVIPACQETAVDAHHILNRNLFVEPDEFGGYFLGNGAGLCSVHHLDAELTLLTTTDLYLFCQESRVLPHHLEGDYEYDTWGNIVVSEFERIPGEMFLDEGCQKALAAAGVLWMFS